MVTTAADSHGATFDVVAAYHHLLQSDSDITMPVAAIEALILALQNNNSTTVSETLDLVSRETVKLKASIPNPISLSAGTDLFQQYLISSLTRPAATQAGILDFDQIRQHLVQNGRLFVDRAKAARTTISGLGRHFIRDGDTVLTNGGSRVVGALLKSAAESSSTSSGRGSLRFRVIYVVSPSSSNIEGRTAESESAAIIAALRERDIPVATIPPTAIAYCMDTVTQCFVGAEGVVENGGVVNRLGTYQMGLLAKAAGKPFYVVSESHKFVRLYPLGQRDLGIEQKIVDFRTADGAVDAINDEGVADLEEGAKKSTAPEDAVDYTPPHLISGIITESGVLLPSAVSEELIKIWF
ncbi:Hypothetical protein R9X50_00737400 [Acrodontium crateriforme]|uniref:Translation initiation factor eIF2B subunit alpha n=1 Tax=Acrodontium crateriforme TaxID=150365 RepID=A0AAQ3RE47_9PEZI|nr:Hypothetical protein R9X50_00737400 [Acrodontium crateriforme]